MEHASEAEAGALDDLLDAGQQLTRSLLDVGADPETLAAGGGASTSPPQIRRSWTSYAPGRFIR